MLHRPITVFIWWKRSQCKPATWLPWRSCARLASRHWKNRIRAERNKYALQVKASQDIEILLNKLNNSPKDEALPLRLKLREQIRSLVAQINVWLDIRKIVIRYNTVDFEQKTVVVFKSKRAMVFLEDKVPG
jgi:hypothetical protein